MNRQRDGGTTEDLRARAATARASVPYAPQRPWYETPSAEEHVRTRGRWLLIAGTAVGILTFALSVVWNIGFHRPMPAAYVLPLYSLAFGAVAIGGQEYLTRAARHESGMCLYRVGQLERHVNALVDLLDEELKQRYYRGVADQARTQIPMTGTEHARPLDKPSGEVLRFPRR